jgi:head-tail adaptor
VFWQSGTRIRAGTTTDRAGDNTPDWSPGAVDELEITGLSIQPRTQAESSTSERPALVVSGWLVISEPGSNPDITAADRFRFDGITCEVDGDIARWPDSDGGVHHVEFALKRATG